jgi:hypothetical protein
VIEKPIPFYAVLALLLALCFAGDAFGVHNDRIQPGDRPMDALVRAVPNSTTADLLNDGFVTLDDVVAMKLAGLTDDEILQRLQATGQVYTLTQSQEKYLQGQGISKYAIMQMETLNQSLYHQFQNTMAGQGNVISRPAPLPH